MKTLISLVLVSAFASQAASAAMLVCTGSIQKFDFTVTAKTAGEGFTGSASAVILKERKPYRNVTMKIVTGEYNPRLLNFIARDAKNQAVVQAVRSNGGHYAGEIVLTGEGAGGETKVSTTCRVR